MERSVKPKPEAKVQKPEKPQIERFKEAARELGCDDTGELFERAFTKIVPPRRPKSGGSTGC